MTRRFAVLVMLLCMFAVLAMLLRKGNLPGMARGPVWRLIGSVVLTRVAAPRLLVGCAGTAAALCLVVLTGAGPLAGYAALAVGLFNSIMFPTIFTLTLERSDAAPSSTSGLLCLAIVGGAALPLLVGRLADAVSLSAAFVVPAAAYGLIALFALAAGRSGQGRARAEHPA